MKLSNCSTAWYRRIVESSNYSMGHLPWNFQVAASDKRCKLHFWPIPRLHAPNDKFVGKRFSDWTTIRRRFQWFVDCRPARIQTMSGGSWIETIRLQWFVDCRPTRFQTMSDSQIETILRLKPRRCKRFSDWNDSPPRLPAPISTIRGLPPPRAKWSCVRFSGFLGFGIYFRWYAFGESRQNIICLGVEWIFGDVLLVSRAKT